eukprot:GHVS01076311.1.p1 GENE.GHVS01076311.1~~GHVS01076311.1.p1  ORF type:complete len:644 (-),score=154.83 GHVS01076311.1:117-2048(-)
MYSHNNTTAADRSAVSTSPPSDDSVTPNEFSREGGEARGAVEGRRLRRGRYAALPELLGQADSSSLEEEEGVPVEERQDVEGSGRGASMGGTRMGRVQAILGAVRRTLRGGDPTTLPTFTRVGRGAVSPSPPATTGEISSVSPQDIEMVEARVIGSSSLAVGGETVVGQPYGGGTTDTTVRPAAEEEDATTNATRPPPPPPERTNSFVDVEESRDGSTEAGSSGWSRLWNAGRTVRETAGRSGVLVRHRAAAAMTAMGVWEQQQDTNAGGGIWGDSSDDDPSCHVILCVLGFLWTPFPWFVGGILFCVTSKGNRRARSVGLINVALASCAALAMALRMYSLPDTTRHAVTFLPAYRHLPSIVEAHTRMPGLVGESTLSSRKLSWSFASDEDWKSFRQSSLTFDPRPPPPVGVATTYGSKNYDRVEGGNDDSWLLGPSSLPLSREPGLYRPTVIFSQPFQVTGRVWLEVEFGEGDAPSPAALREILSIVTAEASGGGGELLFPYGQQSSPVLSKKSSTVVVGKSSFPPVVEFKEYITDYNLPMDFLGGGLRCSAVTDSPPSEASFSPLPSAHKPRAFWELLWKPSSFSAVHPSTGLHLKFPHIHVCRVALVDTVWALDAFSKSTEPTAEKGFIQVASFSIQPLP